METLEQVSDDDWLKLFSLAQRHRVVPSFSNGLSAIGFKVPDVIGVQVAEHCKENAINAMRHSAELVSLTKLFEEYAIEFICIKGLALLKQTHQDLASRHCGDIDLLLRERADIVEVDRLLVNLGYKRFVDIAPKLFGDEHIMEYFSQKDIVYGNPEKKLRLEVHLDVSRFSTFPVSSKDLYDNRAQITIGRTIVPVMSQADHQLYLLVHGSATGWFRLKWLLDIPAVSSNGEAYFADELQERVEKLGIGRMADIGLMMAHSLLGMPVRSELERKYKNDNQLQRLVNFTNKAIFSEIVPGDSSDLKRLSSSVQSYLLYLPMLRREFIYKIRCVRPLFLFIGDYEKFPMRPSLFWLYYPLRPILWLVRKATGSDKEIFK